MIYVIEYKGDLPHTRRLEHPEAFYSLDEAFERLTRLFLTDVEVWEENGKEYKNYPNTPDPEDDRIVVWEMNPGATASAKAVWHFSGWHWLHDANDLPGGPLEQGTLPALNGKSLYDVANGE